MNQEFRPQTIEQIFGQDHLKPLLIRWVHDPNQIPQSLLIHGPYGMGKTSIARILAKKLASDGDIHEMNAAASRGIDDVRAIAEDTVFSGLAGNKVYIIDELHAMTAAAQSALLKVIEEPRPGIYFMLCTTDYAKLLDTIRSRCTQIDVRLLSEQEGLSLIDYVGGSDLDPNTKQKIYMSSNGHARDIVKSVSVGMHNPKLIDEALGTVDTSIKTLTQYMRAPDPTLWSAAAVDEHTAKTVADFFLDHPELWGNNFTRDGYNQALHLKAQATLYLVTQKQRIIHLLSLPYK